MFRPSGIILALAALFGCSPAEPVSSAAEAAPARAPSAAAQRLRLDYLGEPGAAASFFPEPDRRVAEIVSPTWNTVERRDTADESGQIARALGLRAGMTVADVGAGSGYHTVRLSPLLGPSGRVIAQDVTADYLRDLARTVQERKLANVTMALGEPHDPRLPRGAVDVALLVHMYHEVAQPYAFLYNLAPALKPGGRVAVVDLDRETWRHGTPRALLRCELEAVGYRQLSSAELQGGVGYLAVFEAPAEAARPEPGSIHPCRRPAAR